MDNLAWQSVLRHIQNSVKPQQYQAWFQDLRLKEADGPNLTLTVPNEFARQWLARNHLDTLSEAVATVTGEAPNINITVAEPSPSFSGQPLTHDDQRIYERLNPQYTFENFVVGPSNRLPHAAAMAVVDRPGRSYNPLFIHGGVGLGKTHLVHSVCHALLAQPSALKVLYLSCEAFINDYISAIKDGSWEAFRFKYRSADVLLIDDIHFLGSSEHTQEEFFHTFNTLYNAEKQILITSDCAPHELPSIQERLVSRFKWGLVARIEPPAYETRVAIVQRKALLQGIELPDEVVQIIASAITTNVRDLQGAITRIVAHCRTLGSPPNAAIAREVLQDLLPERSHITIADIMNLVCDRFDVRQADLLSRKKSKSIVFPRQLCMHIARRVTGHSLEEIGGFFGGRDHTTVLHADDKIKRAAETDESLRILIDRLIADLQSRR